jgi:hypothetical protein
MGEVAGVVSLMAVTHQAAKSGGGITAVAETASTETNLISAKSSVSQVGESFGNLGATVNEGKISLGGRSVTNGRFDFVVTEAGELKEGNGHYNLSGEAQNVQAAGQLKNFKGEVMEINNASGHYQPSVFEAQSFPSILENTGVNVSKAKLKTYE